MTANRQNKMTNTKLQIFVEIIIHMKVPYITNYYYDIGLVIYTLPKYVANNCVC